MMILTDELREYAKSLFKTKPYHNRLTDIADNIDKDVNKLMIEKYKLEENHERLFSEKLNLADENKQLRELLKDALIQSVQFLKFDNDKLREQGIRLLDKTLELASENDKLRELLHDTLIQTYQYCDKYGIEYEDGADAWDKANDDIDRRLRELGIEVD